MSTHLSDEQLVGLLHGALSSASRAEVKLHLAACERCAAELAREAALDEALFEIRAAHPEMPPPAPPRRRSGGAPVGWLAGATAAVAAAVGIGLAGVGSLGANAQPTPTAAGPLAWQNLVFFIPIAMGVILVMGSVLGGHGHDSDSDAGHDHDHDQDHDQDHDSGHGSAGVLARALTLLGVGRVPLTAALMIAAFLFGGTGIVLNAILAAAGFAPGFYGPISVAASFVYTALLTGQLAKLVQRFLPATETYRVTRHDFAGCAGTLLFDTDATSGYAQVKDREGNVHNLKVRAARGRLPKGTAVLVVMYDEETKSYLVDTEQ